MNHDQTNSKTTSDDGSACLTLSSDNYSLSVCMKQRRPSPRQIKEFQKTVNKNDTNQNPLIIPTESSRSKRDRKREEKKQCRQGMEVGVERCKHFEGVFGRKLMTTFTA